MPSRLGTQEQVRQVAALLAGEGGQPGAADPDDDAPDAADDGGEDRPGAGDGEPDRGGDDAGDDAGEGDDDADQPTGKPTTLDEAAKALGMSRAELNALPVQIGEQTLTLGELKAKLPELVKLDRSRAELDDARGEVELRRVDTERRSRAMLDAVPDGALPILEQRVQAQHRETLRRESELLMSARPKWADTAYSTAERDRMSKAAAKYGFSKAEIGAMVDHRQVLLLQDYAALLERVEAAKVAARKVPDNGSQLVNRQTSQAAAGKQTGRARSTQGQTMERVARIIREG